MLPAVSRSYPRPQGRFPRVTHPSATHPLLSASDLHVLGAPPAFVLSQDQTLMNCLLLAPGPSGHRCKTPSLAVFLSRYSVVKEHPDRPKIIGAVHSTTASEGCQGAVPIVARIYRGSSRSGGYIVRRRLLSSTTHRLFHLTPAARSVYTMREKTRRSFDEVAASIMDPTWVRSRVTPRGLNAMAACEHKFPSR